MSQLKQPGTNLQKLAPERRINQPRKANIVPHRFNPPSSPSPGEPQGRDRRRGVTMARDLAIELEC